MRVEGVRHHRHHHSSDQDHHTERYCAAVAGHLGAPCGGSQLTLVDVGDACRDEGVPPDFIPAPMEGGWWRPQGAPGDSGTTFAVESIWHAELTREEKVRHGDDRDVSQSEDRVFKNREDNEYKWRKVRLILL